MTSLRILKKLSKRAAPYLPLLGDRREQFPAPRGECSGAGPSDRLPFKHWSRSKCHPTYRPPEYERTVVRQTRAGNTIAIRPYAEARKGTIMAGGMSGYYEPEWDEDTAWEALRTLVLDAHTDWETMAHDRPPRPFPAALRRPSGIFKAADALIVERSPTAIEQRGEG